VKLFLAIAFIATVLFAFATYHPTRVCEHTRVKTTMTYNGTNGGAVVSTTDPADLFCHDSHQ
jgi:hypothetical protein